jgi:hypothetical protein
MWFRIEYLKEVPGVLCTVKRTPSLMDPTWTTNDVSEEFYVPSINRFARQVPAGAFHPSQFLRLSLELP